MAKRLCSSPSSSFAPPLRRELALPGRGRRRGRTLTFALDNGVRGLPLLGRAEAGVRAEQGMLRAALAAVATAGVSAFVPVRGPLEEARR
jgi:hypothetical protein